MDCGDAARTLATRRNLEVGRPKHRPAWATGVGLDVFSPLIVLAIASLVAKLTSRLVTMPS